LAPKRTPFYTRSSPRDDEWDPPINLKTISGKCAEKMTDSVAKLRNSLTDVLMQMEIISGVTTDSRRQDGSLPEDFDDVEQCLFQLGYDVSEADTVARMSSIYAGIDESLTVCDKTAFAYSVMNNHVKDIWVVTVSTDKVCYESPKKQGVSRFEIKGFHKLGQHVPALLEKERLIHIDADGVEIDLPIQTCTVERSLRTYEWDELPLWKDEYLCHMFAVIAVGKFLGNEHVLLMSNCCWKQPMSSLRLLYS
jgi:hypothetical protein